jgi:hypothetical protein
MHPWRCTPSPAPCATSAPPPPRAPRSTPAQTCTRLPRPCLQRVGRAPRRVTQAERAGGTTGAVHAPSSVGLGCAKWQVPSTTAAGQLPPTPSAANCSGQQPTWHRMQSRVCAVCSAHLNSPSSCWYSHVRGGSARVAGARPTAMVDPKPAARKMARGPGARAHSKQTVAESQGVQGWHGMVAAVQH